MTSSGERVNADKDIDQPPSDHVAGSGPAHAPARRLIVGIGERLIIVPELSLVLAIIAFSAVVGSQNSSFLHYDNLILVLKSAAPTFVVAATMAFVLIGGGIDLSVGSMAALGGIVTAKALHGGIPVPISILISLLVCGSVGGINGLLVARAGIPPLIVTLGALYAIRGVVLLLTGGQQVFPLPDGFNSIAQDSIFSVPYLVLYGIAIGAAAHVALAHSVYGYRVRAVGGNAAAARASGINVIRTRTSLYVLSGVGAGLAGVLMTSFVGDGDPSAGQGMELSVIAAVIVGGTSLFGAIGSIPGTALGVVLLALVSNGLLLLSVSPYYQFVVLGVVVVAAVGIDQVRRTQFWRRAS